MPPVSIEEIKRTFFGFGSISEETSPALFEKVNHYGAPLEIREIDGQGSFFFTRPFYADIEENEDMVWIKLGIVHDGVNQYSMQEIIQNKWVSIDGVRVEEISGSTTLIGIRKNMPMSYVYGNLVSPPLIYYWSDGENYIITDNLHLMIYFIPNPKLNKNILAQHYIYRFVFGEESYIKGVKKLLPGEMITQNRGDLKVGLIRDFRPFSDPYNQKPVSSESIEWFVNEFRDVISMHLRGKERNSATALSGGVDSSFIQFAINADRSVDFRFPSFSFAIDSPSFDYEIEYAKEAVREFNTEHTFVSFSPQEFSDLIIESTKVLGRPISFDGTAYYHGLIKYLSDYEENIHYVFDGTVADGLLGNPMSTKIIQGDKYRNWPIPLLKFIGLFIKPISTDKSFGALSAAQTLSDQNNLNSPECYLNMRGMGTDWDTVSKCFPKEVLEDALAVNRKIEKRYLNSKLFVEQFNVMGLLTGAIENALLVRQLGLYGGKEFIFPYTDESIVKAAFTFTPLERYTYRNLSKPVLRLGLESKSRLSVFDQRKGQSSLMSESVFSWMRDGALRDLVRSIERPPFMSTSDFKNKISEPDWLTWNMLTMDLFMKNVLGSS